jgi:hypothetical protein
MGMNDASGRSRPDGSYFCSLMSKVCLQGKIITNTKLFLDYQIPNSKPLSSNSGFLEGDVYQFVHIPILSNPRQTIKLFNSRTAQTFTNFLCATFQSSTLFFKLSALTSSKISTPSLAGKLYLWCLSNALIVSKLSFGSSKSLLKHSRQ